MRNYAVGIFHMLIIACLGFALFGCGFKGPPIYKENNETKYPKNIKTTIK